MNKLTAVYASQSQGSGKTFLVKHLREFMIKDMKSSDSVVKELMENSAYLHLTTHLTALANTRSIVISVDKLSTECASFEEAVVVEVVSQLCGKYPKEVLNEVRARRLNLSLLCDELLTQNHALIIVLDDVMDLVCSERPVHLAWLHSVALQIDTREQKTRAVMILLKDLLKSVLGKPGALLYLTGRTPDVTYQLLTNIKSAPLLARSVLLDGLQHAHIVEVLTLTCLGETDVKLCEGMGLRNSNEVDELARWALFHTGGVPRVLTCLFFELLSGEYLAPAHRASDQTVSDALSATNMPNHLFQQVKLSVPHGIVPNWWELNTKTGWDTDLTTASLIEVLHAARDNTPVDCSVQVKVAEGERVEAVELLSVLGVPFKRTDGDTMTVQLGAWMIRALLEGKTVSWTQDEVRQQIQWMREAAEDDVELDRIVLSLVK